ncbi:hypothetical protein V6N11_000270 [Hibiscus sabdariffa]|uniref:1-aminocyclopropane-1-carboxylate synthase n=1 Tax=Hibiscus sabdariffa TaxID=183260 RepID=A0ABR2A257_9ROSI
MGSWLGDLPSFDPHNFSQLRPSAHSDLSKPAPVTYHPTHNRTLPPPDQVITTEAKNILIRSFYQQAEEKTRVIQLVCCPIWFTSGETHARGTCFEIGNLDATVVQRPKLGPHEEAIVPAAQSQPFLVNHKAKIHSLQSETKMVAISKIATGNGHGENSPYFDGWKAYEANPFHPTDRPDGVIQMGLAENQLCFSLIKKWVMQHPEASLCSVEGVDRFKETALFQDYHGMPEFRQAVAKFMGKVRGDRVKFDPDRIVMSGGATGAHEMVAFCLADPGEAFLVPTPYYPGFRKSINYSKLSPSICRFDRDLRWRTGVQLVPVVCESWNNFKITRNALEAAYEKATEANLRVKGLLITNPSNPLGTILDRETLRSVVKFIDEKNIHLIGDEIYAATVFMEPEFVSISEIIEEVECNRDLIHIVYSLSKDMGFPGFRVGIVYSYNDAVVSCARKMSSFGLVSSQTQHLIASMLSDDEFVDSFIAESKDQLSKRHKYFTWNLSQVGIGSLKSNAGLFIWMDLRKLLKEKTFEAEMDLWRVIINEVKLNVSPGSSFHCNEPGWFRVCFANMDDHTMEVALSRIRTFMLKHNDAMVPRKLCRRSSLKLSFSQRRDDLMSPSIMSPHSPIPQSPLVRART